MINFICLIFNQIIELKGKIHLEEQFDAIKAYNSIHERCNVLHKGIDGVSMDVLKEFDDNNLKHVKLILDGWWDDEEIHEEELILADCMDMLFEPYSQVKSISIHNIKKIKHPEFT